MALSLLTSLLHVTLLLLTAGLFPLVAALAVHQQDQAAAFIAACSRIQGTLSTQSRVDLPPNLVAHYQHAHHWFQSSSQPAACIVEAGSPEDVAATLRIVGETRTPFAVMSGGHASNPGFSSTPGVHISLKRMDGVVLKPGGAEEGSTVVEVGFGARWSDVFMKLEGTGYNLVGGRVGGPGVGGVTLGGGYSWKTNQFGLTIDTVKSFNVVLPNGTITSASNSTNSDLFFALKGGLNRFGIVTSAEFYAHKQPPKVFGGFIVYPSFSFNAVLDATMEFYRTSKDPRTQIITTTVSSPIGGSSALVIFFHDAGKKPKSFDRFTRIPHLVNTMRAQRFFEFVDGIPSEILALVNFRGAFATMSTSSLTPTFLDAVKNETDRSGQLMVRHHGVQINYDIEPFVNYGKFATDSAFPHDYSPLPLNLYFAWGSEADDNFWYDQMRGSLDRLKTVAASEGIYKDTFTQYPNYALFDTTAEELYGKENTGRLGKIRDAVDPDRIMDLAGGFVI